MTERIKNWNWVNIIITSLLGLILFMVTAFYDDYRADKRTRYERDKDMDKEIKEIQTITLNLAKGYDYLDNRLNNHDQKDTDQDKQIMELWKMQNRSAGEIPSIMKDGK